MHDNARRMRVAAWVGALALTALPSLAQAYTVTLSDRYVLQQQDTVSLARALLSDRLQQRAVEQNGRYIALQQVLTNEGFADSSVHVLSSALVEVIDSQETLSQDDQGRQVLTRQETLRIDPDSLERRVEAFHRNHELALALRQLSAENDRLRQQRGVLFDTVRIGDPVARANAFEQWQRDLARWQAQAVSLEEVAEAQEALVLSPSTPQQASDAVFYRLERVRGQLQTQLRPEIVHQAVIGDTLELDIRVSGLHNAEALIRDALGFPLSSDGLLYPEDYRTWPHDQQTQFRQALATVAMLPMYVKVEAGHERDQWGGFVKATRRGYVDHRYDHQSHLLFGTMTYRPGGDRRGSARHFPLQQARANDLAAQDYFATTELGYAGELGKRLTLGLAPATSSYNQAVTVEPDGAIRVRLKLNAEYGVPPYILASVVLGNWDHY